MLQSDCTPRSEAKVITLTYQYKLKVNRQQQREIVHILDVCQSVYNYALAQRKDWINSRKCPVDRCSLVSEYIIPANKPYPNYFAQAKNLTEAKKAYPILKTVNAQVLQQVLKTLDRAFSDMKSKGFGSVSFQSKESVPALTVGKTCLGIDAGIENFVATSQGNSWSRGSFRKQSLDAGIGSFINEILPFVAKSLSERVHWCDSCGHIEPRDTASAKVSENRGKNAVRPTVLENARGGDLAGVVQLNLFDLVKSLRTENPPLHRVSG